MRGPGSGRPAGASGRGVPATSETIEVGEVALAVERAGGEGDPTVLVHDGWTDRHLWDRTVPRLRSSLQLLTYDRRGHGESHGPARAHPLRDDAADLAALLEATGLYPAHVVALGYGGGVALRLAADRPELVRSVLAHEVPAYDLGDDVGSGSPAGGLRGALRAVLADLRERGPTAAATSYLAAFAAPEERWERADDAWRRRMLREAAAWEQEIVDPEVRRPPRGELEGITVPLLLTSGGRSPSETADVQGRLAAGLPNASTLRLGEGGHFAPWYAPDLFAGVVGTFLLERNVPSL
jgi:pimeloyl-ACP methyl ester carboxylesterase